MQHFLKKKYGSITENRVLNFKMSAVPNINNFLLASTTNLI